MEKKQKQQNYSQENIKKLSGTRLQIVQCLTKSDNRTLGVRDIQRQLNLSSVSLADYHLTKLLEMKLVEKTKTNKYRLTQLLPVGEFENHILIKNKLIPKYSFYLVFIFTFLSASFILAIMGLWEVLIVSFFLFEIVVILRELVDTFKKASKNNDL